MSGTFFMLGRFLAQTQSSGLREFLQQISGLLITTCVAGAIWVVLLLLVVQRARERRRRERLGLEPLPGFWVGVARRARALLAPAEGKGTAPSPDAEELPAPDLDALTGGLPEPELDALVGEEAPTPVVTEPEPAHTVPSTPPAERQTALSEEALEPSEEIPPHPFTEEAPMPTEPPNPQDTVEVLRLFRDISDGTLIVEISGRRFTSLAELRSAALERRFLRVLEEMQRFSEPPRLVPRAALSSADEVEGTPADGFAEDDELPSLALGSMFRQMRRAAMGQAPPPSEPPPALSIAEEIEALLQEKLTTLPAFRERTIHVTSAPAGGVLIQVDERFYEGVDEIQEEDVRLLLQEVVAEWQKRL